MSKEDIPSDYYPRRNKWVKALFTLVILFGYGFSEAILWFLTILQFFWTLFKAEPNFHIQKFGSSLIKWNGSAIAYCLLKSNEAPFPFSSWPDGND
jgi:hypothetical protein